MNAASDEANAIRVDNLNRLIYSKKLNNRTFSDLAGVKPSGLGRARSGKGYMSDKMCGKIIETLNLAEDYFDIDNRTGDEPVKQKKSPPAVSKMVTIQFQGDSFNVSVEVNESKARQMIMSLLHE